MYADDVAITYSASSIAKAEENLSTDMKTICQCLHDWHLKLSQSKNGVIAVPPSKPSDLEINYINLGPQRNPEL